MEENNNALQNEELQEDLKPTIFNLSKGDTVFAVGAFITVILLSMFGIFNGFALGYLIASTLTIILFSVYLGKNGKVRFLPFIRGLLALANGAIFVCTTNSSVRFFGFLVSFLLSIVCFDGFAIGTAKGNRQTLGIFLSAVSTIMNTGLTVKSLFAGNKEKKKLIGKAVVGLICAMPVLFVVVPLLISSDDAFKGMMSNIFSNTFSFFLKILFALFICPFFISYGFSLKTGRVSRIKESNFKGIDSIYLISFLSAISVSYVLYLFSQLAYFFSAFKGFLPEGDITYAQYARKGFFEMCVIAVINLLIVFLALLLAKKENGKVCHTIKAIATFISVFTLIIIATAISKMVLYIGTYGMTVLRITTSSFMLFLSIVFISVILRIYINKVNIVKTALITAGVILLLLGTVNVNSVCARYNYESYKAERLEKIDVKGLYELGPEGIPYIVKLTSNEDFDVVNEAQEYLARAYLYDYFDNLENAQSFTLDDLKANEKNKGFAHYNIPKAMAYDALYNYIEENPWFSSICQNYFEVSVETYYSEF